MQNNNESIFSEAIGIFLPEEQTHHLKFYDITGGVNNWTRGCLTQHDDFVVRVYNNGKDTHKVRLEHQLLLKLQKMEKSFKTPELLKIPGSEETLAILKDGHPCCVIRKIEGSLPKSFTNEGLFNFGSAVAELSNLLSKITLSQKPIIKPYFELYKVHRSITKEKLHDEISSKEYDSVRSHVEKLLKFIELTESKIQEYHTIHLPIQLIHGDVHNDNILVKDNKLSAILDFQFVAEDWRAMEMAISLSKFANLPQFFEMTKHFKKGYAQRQQLSQQELKAVPWLIILRLVSNFVYFVGRVIAKEQSIDFCRQKIILYSERIEKLLPKIQQFQNVLLQKQQKK